MARPPPHGLVSLWAVDSTLVEHQENRRVCPRHDEWSSRPGAGPWRLHPDRCRTRRPDAL